MEVTTFQILTFVVAAVGLVFAAASLGWNVAQFHLTGGRPSIDLIRGVLTPTGVITVPLNGNADRQLAQLRAEHGYTEQVIGVVVRNTGRTSVRVQRWGISCPGTAEYWLIGDSLGPTLPASIEGGAQQTWVTPIEPAYALAYASAGIRTDEPAVHGKVELGDGKLLLSKTAMTFGVARH